MSQKVACVSVSNQRVREEEVLLGESEAVLKVPHGEAEGVTKVPQGEDEGEVPLGEPQNL